MNRRVKTYVTEIEMSNMLFMSTGKSIAYVIIEKDANGEYPDAYTWPHLNACLDRASPNVAMDSHLGYGDAKLNVNVDWDLEHDTKNSSNAAMRDTGLWRGACFPCIRAQLYIWITVVPSQARPNH